MSILAIERLSRHWVRNALAAAGIAISVGAMTVTANLIGSVYLEATRGLRRMGANLLFVVPKDFAQFGRTGRPITLSDVRVLRKATGTFDAVYPIISVRGTVHACGRSRLAHIVGALPETYDVEEWRVTGGRFISTTDVARRAPVALIGAQLRDDLRCVRVDDYITVKDRPMRVIGHLGRQGQRFGINRDDIVLIPMSQAEADYGSRAQGLAIALRRRPSVAGSVAEEEIRRVLRREHRLASADDFEIHTQTQMLEAIASSVTTLAVLVLMGVSLVVSAIGVLNSLLVGVASRTSEIGLRRSVGATRTHIVRQFTAETLVIAVAGALPGSAWGWDSPPRSFVSRRFKCGSAFRLPLCRWSPLS